jgi:hypothetical protein
MSFGQLDIVLDSARQVTGGRFAVTPLRRFERLTAFGDLRGAQHVGDLEQHPASELQFSVDMGFRLTIAEWRATAGKSNRSDDAPYRLPLGCAQTSRRFGHGMPHRFL